MGSVSLTHLAFLVVMLFLTVIFPLMAIIEVAKSTNKNKVLWIVAIFFFNFLGAALYWAIGRQK